MKKVLILTLCLGLIPMLFAANESDTRVPMLQLQNPNKPLDNPVFKRNPLEGNRDVLLSQIPDTVNASNMACQLDSVYPFEADVADDIQPSGAGWRIDSVISWWWNWNGFTSWSNVPNIHFIVYDDNGGQPADNPSQEIVCEPSNWTTYEYVAGQRWRLEIELPTSVNLTGGATYWIEIQPSNVFNTNGQTGIVGEPGCGNGQEAYFRGAIFGYPNWVTATTVFGQPNEAGFILIGQPLGGTLHDVGVAAINAPGATEMPNTTIAPEAVYHNYGTETETFDIYFVIDSSGTTIYNQTDNITLASGAETTYTWPNWTTGPNDGITYDVMAYTVLSGDENPANDTMAMQTVTQSIFWKIYSSNLPQSTYYHAMAALDVGGSPKVYSTGGNTNLSEIDEFDVGTETWTVSSATLSTPAQRHAAVACNGLVYIAGGCDASFNAINNMQEFDPVAGTVTEVTPLPTARHFLGAVCWKDTLIYVMGGQSGSSYFNVVEIYDPATDSWTTGTAMPITNRSFACGIFGDTIYVAGGYNGAYVTGAWMGIINPSDPTQITWTAIADIPTGASGQPGRSRIQGACDANGYFYFVGGDDHGTVGVDCWYYDPGDASWHQQPDKPTAMSNTQAAVFVNDLDGGTFFCAGGYTGAPGNATEGLVNLGQFGVAERPDNNQVISNFGFVNVTNPTKGAANISFITPISGHVTLKVYDGMGRYVETLVNSTKPAGINTVTWNTDNLANGVYFFHLEAADNTATQKLILVK